MIKQEILKRIENLIDSQTEKGIEKYKKTLDSCRYHEYDWQQMIIEELIDAVQYQQKEIQYLYDLNKKHVESTSFFKSRMPAIPDEKLAVIIKELDIQVDDWEAMDFEDFLHHLQKISGE